MNHRRRSILAGLKPRRRYSHKPAAVYGTSSIVAAYPTFARMEELRKHITDRILSAFGLPEKSVKGE